MILPRLTGSIFSPTSRYKHLKEATGDIPDDRTPMRETAAARGGEQRGRRSPSPPPPPPPPPAAPRQVTPTAKDILQFPTD